MKSIMQEASSIIKAIEKGWENAGKPKEFSIKIFEEPKKNFIGITTHSAKVGIFFEEEKLTKEPKEHEGKEKKQPKKLDFKPDYKSKKELTKLEKFETKESSASNQEPSIKSHKEVWTPEMIAFAEQWLREVLRSINQNITFTIQPQHYRLFIQFNDSLLQNAEKEQQLLRSFSLLLIQTLRHALKRPLRGFKIIMTKA
jgi:predicted RNA-binding protein Jag